MRAESFSEHLQNPSGMRRGAESSTGLFEHGLAKSAEHSALFLSGAVEFFIISIRNKGAAFGNGSLRDHFEKGASRDFQEMRKVLSRVSSRPFSNVGGDRDCRTLHLARQAEALGFRKGLGEGVNEVSKLNGALPNVEFFEVKHRSESFLVMRKEAMKKKKLGDEPSPLR